MGGGILNGMILGLVISGVVLAALSLSTPLPERPGAPQATQSPQASAPETQAEPAAPVVAEGSADAPASVSDVPGGGAQAEASAPSEVVTSPDTTPPADVTPQVMAAPQSATEPDAREGMPEPDPDPPAASTAAPEPEAGASIPPAAPRQPVATQTPASLPRPDAGPQTVPRLPQAAAPAQDSAPTRDTVAAAPAAAISVVPDIPSPDVIAPAPSPVFSTTADASAGGIAPRRLEMPQVQAAPTDTDTAPAPAPTPAPGPAPGLALVPQPAAQPDARPTVPASSATAPVAAAEAMPPRLPQVEGVSDTAPSPGRLPQAGLPAIPAEPPAAPEAAAMETAEPDPVPPNALRDHAEAFEAEPGTPLMAIVLIDEADSGFDPTALGGLGFPVSFAIDPMRPDAAARATALRAAGFEVVILGASALPAGATPSDVEVALGVARETLPQAVALMDDPASRIQSDRPVLDATVGALAATGHGLIAFPRGLNAAEETARRADVPAATVFRMLDDEDQNAPVITRFLGRAAFAAAQEGAVVVVGRTRPDTVTALMSWALGSRTEGVALAPVSAVLQRLSE